MFFLFLLCFSLFSTISSEQSDVICLNGGTKIKIKTLADDPIRCNCPIGWFGKKCEFESQKPILNTTIYFKNSKLCGLHGTLAAFVVSANLRIFFCECKQGFMGSFCKKEITPLDSLKYSNTTTLKKTWIDSFCFSSLSCNHFGECLQLRYFNLHISFCHCQPNHSGPDCSDENDYDTDIALTLFK